MHNVVTPSSIDRFDGHAMGASIGIPNIPTDFPPAHSNSTRTARKFSPQAAGNAWWRRKNGK